MKIGNDDLIDGLIYNGEIGIKNNEKIDEFGKKVANVLVIAGIHIGNVNDLSLTRAIVKILN